MKFGQFLVDELGQLAVKFVPHCIDYLQLKKIIALAVKEREQITAEVETPIKKEKEKGMGTTTTKTKKSQGQSNMVRVKRYDKKLNNADSEDDDDNDNGGNEDEDEGCHDPMAVTGDDGNNPYLPRRRSSSVNKPIAIPESPTQIRQRRINGNAGVPDVAAGGGHGQRRLHGEKDGGAPALAPGPGNEHEVSIAHRIAYNEKQLSRVHKCFFHSHRERQAHSHSGGASGVVTADFSEEERTQHYGHWRIIDDGEIEGGVHPWAASSSSSSTSSSGTRSTALQIPRASRPALLSMDAARHMQAIEPDSDHLVFHLDLDLDVDDADENPHSSHPVPPPHPHDHRNQHHPFRLYLHQPNRFTLSSSPVLETRRNPTLREGLSGQLGGNESGKKNNNSHYHTHNHNHNSFQQGPFGSETAHADISASTAYTTSPAGAGPRTSSAHGLADSDVSSETDAYVPPYESNCSDCRQGKIAAMQVRSIAG